MSFILSKLFWVLLSPGNALLILLLVGLAFLVAPFDTARHVLGRRLCFIAAMAFLCIAFLPIANWLMTPLESQFPRAKPDHVDGIILLGGDENPRISEGRQTANVHASAARYLEFISLAREYPNAQLVFAGGSGLLLPYHGMTEAEVARQALAAAGLPLSRVLFEEKSRTTHENALFSAALVHPTLEQNWLLVTSAWHMPRAIATFHAAGYKVFSAPTDYWTDGSFVSPISFNLNERLSIVTIAVHEYIGLLAYRIMGYTDTLWPSPWQQ